VGSLSDEELCAQALAADPDAGLPHDAECFWTVADAVGARALPEWYMPPVATVPRHWTGWRRQLIRFNVGFVVLSFLTINAYGLCNTYGQLHF
jgi:hypothetical protein